MRVVVLCCVLGVLLAGADTASADWLAIRQIDEFDQKHRFVAASSVDAPSLAFICEAETGKMKLFYKSGVRASRLLRKELPIWPVWIAVIVDDQPVKSFPGMMSEMSRMVTFESYDAGAVALSGTIANAKRRVLVAIDYAGEKVNRNEFSVAGSAKPILMVFEACKNSQKK